MRPRAWAALCACLVLAGCTAQSTPAPSPTLPSPSPEVSPAAPTASPAPVASPSPEPHLAWGPLESEWEEALADARALSVAEAAGQVMVADLYSPDPAEAAALVRRWHLGGVILMGGSVTDAAGVTALARAVQDAAPGSWPVLVSGDQEGGVVSRLSPVVRGMPAFMAAGAARDKAAVEDAFAAMGADLAAVGVTVDFAPVADVTIGPADPVIRTRSAGSDPADVATTVEAAVAGLGAGGVVPVLKHFPGHGSVTVDSHHDLPVQSASVAQLENRDLIPFARAIEAGAPAVMMGHIAVPAWGDDPATTSPAAYAYLREDLGFTGVVVTDALNMGAITDRYPAGEAAVRALRAGADLLVMPVSVPDAVAAVEAAVADGSLARERLDEAAARVIALARWQDGLEPVPVPEGDYARALAVAGAVVASDTCGTPPVTDAVRIVAGPDDARAALTTALRRRGVEVGDQGPTLALAGASPAEADIVVADREPWVLESSRATISVGLFGASDSAMWALADVLTGAEAAGGAWPVTVEGLPPTC